MCTSSFLVMPKVNKKILGKRQQNNDDTYGYMSTPWNIMLKKFSIIFRVECNAKLMLKILPMDVERWKEKTLIPDGWLAKGNKLMDNWAIWKIVEPENPVFIVFFLHLIVFVCWRSNVFNDLWFNGTSLLSYFQWWNGFQVTFVYCY